MKFDTTPGKPLVNGQLGGASNAYVDADGVQVTDGTSVRVFLGKLPSGDYGLRIVSSDGSTVIIDGTSDVFKIASSGTLATSSFTNPANPGDESEVTLATGLTSVPANLIYTAFAVSTQAYLTPYAIYNNDGTAADWFDGRAELVAPDQTKVLVAVASSRSAGTTIAYTFRYFLLQETAF